MRTIDRSELQALLDRDAPVRVVMTLGPDRYRAAHIPGTETFASVEEGLTSLRADDDIVVYCSGDACASSRAAYRLLESHGFRNVRRYAGGLEDWAGAGLPLSGTGALGLAA